jgi:MFS family permease
VTRGPEASEVSDTDSDLRPVAGAPEFATAGAGFGEAAAAAISATDDLAAPEPAATDDAPPLGKNRDFKIVLGGQSISALGDAVSFTAVPLLVLALTGSGVAMGTIGALQTLPDLILGLPAGALADRWDRRKMMLWADLGRALLTALIPISVLAGWDTIAVLLLVTAPINALRVMFMAAFTGAVPSLVGRAQVGRANGYSEAIVSLSFIVGPSIAGILVGFIGARETLAIDALSFLVSAASLTFVRRPMQKPRSSSQTHLVADILEGLRYILREPTLRTVILFWSLVSIVSASLVNAVIFLLKIEQGLSSSVLGLVLSGYGIGYSLGAVLAGRFAKGRLGLFMLGANVVSAVWLLLFALVQHPLAQAIGAIGTGVSGALVLISYVTMRATIPPDHLLGRVGSTARMLSLGLSPIGVLAGGVLLDAVGGRETMLLIAGALVLISAVFVLSPTMRNAVAGDGRQ